MGNTKSKAAEAASATASQPKENIVGEEEHDIPQKQGEEKWDDIKIDASVFNDGYQSSSISETIGTLTDYGFMGKENESERLLKDCMELRKSKAKYEISESGHATFYPSESVGVKVSKKKLETDEFLKSKRFQEIMKHLNCSKIEHVFAKNVEIVQNASYINPFAAAAEYAFYLHYPFKIKPSDIWLLILHGTALHISRNAEKLRDKFVNHDGKKKLIVARPEFVKGGENNDWDGVVNEFVEQIDANTVKDVVSLFEPDFSTATLIDRLAARVTTMDILQEYFEYEMLCGCGFPQITLEGTKDDWVNLKNKAKALLTTKVVPAFGQKWGQALMPVLQRFIDVYDGNICNLFWNSMVRRGASGASGNTYLPRVGDLNGYYCGWLNVFFPYNETRKEGSASGRGMGNEAKTKNKKKPSKNATVAFNSYCTPYSKKASYVLKGLREANEDGMDAENFPLGIGAAPVIYKDVPSGKQYDLKFVSGFLGIEQNSDNLELSCKIGWFVAEK